MTWHSFYSTAGALTSHLSLHSDGQSVAIRAFRRRHFLHVPMRLQHQFFRHRLVIWVSQSKAAVAAFSTRFDWTVSRDWEGTVLTRLDLQELKRKINTIQNG